MKDKYYELAEECAKDARKITIDTDNYGSYRSILFTKEIFSKLFICRLKEKNIPWIDEKEYK